MVVPLVPEILSISAPLESARQKMSTDALDTIFPENEMTGVKGGRFGYFLC